MFIPTYQTILKWTPGQDQLIGVNKTKTKRTAYFLNLRFLSSKIIYLLFLEELVQTQTQTQMCVKASVFLSGVTLQLNFFSQLKSYFKLKLVFEKELLVI